MMKLLPLFILSLVTSFSYADAGKADEKRIAEVRRIYDNVNKEIAKMEKSEEAAKESWLAVDTYTANALGKSWPAVGNHKVEYKFYYKRGEQKGDGNYPDKLVKITRKSVSAAREYYEEFYYGESNQLVFYFKATDPDFVDEWRFYFAEKKAIRIKIGKKSRDGYTEGDAETVKTILGRSENVRKKFSKEDAGGGTWFGS